MAFEKSELALIKHSDSCSCCPCCRTVRHSSVPTLRWQPCGCYPPHGPQQPDEASLASGGAGLMRMWSWSKVSDQLPTESFGRLDEGYEWDADGCGCHLLSRTVVLHGVSGIDATRHAGQGGLAVSTACGIAGRGLMKRHRSFVSLLQRGEHKGSDTIVTRAEFLQNWDLRRGLRTLKRKSSRTSCTDGVSFLSLSVSGC